MKTKLLFSATMLAISNFAFGQDGVQQIQIKTISAN